MTGQLQPTRDQLERLTSEPLTEIVRLHTLLMQTARTDLDARAVAHAMHLRLLRLTLDLGACLGVRTPARRHTDLPSPTVGEAIREELNRG